MTTINPRDGRKKGAAMRNRKPERPVNHRSDSIDCVCPRFAPGASRVKIRGLDCKCQIFVQGKNGKYVRTVFTAPMNIDLYENSRYNDRLFDRGDSGQRRHNVGAEKKKKQDALTAQILGTYGEDW